MNVGIITGSRADYGLLKYLIKQISENSFFKLHIYVTGSHLEKRFGHTYQEIISDGYEIHHKIPLSLDDPTNHGVARGLANSISGFSDTFDQFKPDLIIVLGDRYEIFGAVISAKLHNIPVAHLHGGEKTIGSLDDSIRHAITLFSDLHFVAHEEYMSRVLQLGADPKNVFLVGGMGIEAIKKIKLFGKRYLEDKYQFKFQDQNFLITLHPDTLDTKSTGTQIMCLLDVLEKYEQALQIFTMPNADSNNDIIEKSIKKYVRTRKNAILIKSFGHQDYLSCLQFINVVIGNSSSGILEAPSFNVATLNIGNRQKGRVLSESVVNADFTEASIIEALSYIETEAFRNKLKLATNPFDRGNPSAKIAEILQAVDAKGLGQHEFIDIKRETFK